MTQETGNALSYILDLTRSFYDDFERSYGQKSGFHVLCDLDRDLGPILTKKRCLPSEYIDESTVKV